MEPSIPIGALIVSEQVEIETVQVEDVVCFYSKSSDMLGKIITHRVTEKTVADNGEVLLLTKGDANLTIDGHYVDEGNLVGKVIYSMGDSNFFTDLISFLTSKSGFVVCIALPVLFLSGLVLRNSIKNVKRDMANLVEQVNRVEAKVDTAVNDSNSENTNGGQITDEEYQEMYNRIKAELMEELKEELKQLEKREETK